MSHEINQACASFMHVLSFDMIRCIRLFLFVKIPRVSYVGVEREILNTLDNEEPITIRSGIIAMNGYMEDDSIDNDNQS